MTSRRRAGVAKGQERHLRRSLLLAFIFVAIGFDGTALGQSSDGLNIAANGKLRAGMIAIRVLGGVAEPVGKFISTKLGVLYLKSAEIVRIPLSEHISADAVELLRSGRADAFGADSGVGYPAAESLPGASIVPGTFNVVRVAVALPKGRSPEAQAKIAEIVSEAKRNGIVQKAIDAAGLKGVHVAPE
jgi:hypothetical protein